jgi:hypothetical protein
MGYKGDARTPDTDPQGQITEGVLLFYVWEGKMPKKVRPTKIFVDVWNLGGHNLLRMYVQGPAGFRQLAVKVISNINEQDAVLSRWLEWMQAWALVLSKGLGWEYVYNNHIS